MQKTSTLRTRFLAPNYTFYVILTSEKRKPLELVTRCPLLRGFTVYPSLCTTVIYEFLMDARSAYFVSLLSLGSIVMCVNANQGAVGGKRSEPPYTCNCSLHAGSCFFHSLLYPIYHTCIHVIKRCK